MVNKKPPHERQQQRRLRSAMHPHFHPLASDPWGYPSGFFYPPGQLPMGAGRGLPGYGLRPIYRGRSVQRTQPIAPVKPFPPDPYINQLSLAEALQTGTLFRWLREADEAAREEEKAEQGGSLDS